MYLFTYTIIFIITSSVVKTDCIHTSKHASDRLRPESLYITAVLNNVPL